MEDGAGGSEESLQVITPKDFKWTRITSNAASGGWDAR